MAPIPSASRRGSPRSPVPLVLLALAMAVTACDDATEPEDRIVEGVNITALFAAPTEAEIAAVVQEWESREPSAADVAVEASFDRVLNGGAATARVVSAITDGNRHYGIVQAVDGAPAASLPVLLVAHGGDGGTSLAEVDLVTAALGDLASEFVMAAPAFRSETLTAGDASYASEGEPSPWDQDVDDALAFVQAAAEVVPAADPTRVAVVGFSRGGGVALLMGIREPAIEQVVEFFGPTDMFSDWVEELVVLALGGTIIDLPGLADLDAQVIQPLQRGEIELAEARMELVRRSSVLFADRLPDTQLHHGALDPVVPVTQGEALIDAMDALGRTPPSFEGYLYPLGTHDPFSLDGALPRVYTALTRVVGEPQAVAAGPAAGYGDGVPHR
jgi:acetyl esterase/lipase